MRIQSTPRDPSPPLHDVPRSTRPAAVKRPPTVSETTVVEYSKPACVKLAVATAPKPEARTVLQAIRDFFVSLGTALLGTLARAALSIVSTVQTALGLESQGDRLPKHARALAKKIFGDAINLSQVRIKSGFTGLFSLSDRPFATGNTIYWKGVDPRNTAMLMHELVHVWQHQNEGASAFGYALGQQVVGSITGTTDDAYDWTAAVQRGLAFERMSPECQGQLIEDAVASGYFDKAESCRQFVQNGVDYTQALEHALEVLGGEG
jgi:hypothetical protein